MRESAIKSQVSFSFGFAFFWLHHKFILTMTPVKTEQKEGCDDIQLPIWPQSLTWDYGLFF